MESTEIGLKLSRQSWAPSLKRGVTRAIFHLVGKQPLWIDKLINLVNGYKRTGETSFRTFTLISSAPVAFEDDKLSINFWVSCTVIRGILNCVTKLSTVEETNSSSFEESKETDKVWLCLSFEQQTRMNANFSSPFQRAKVSQRAITFTNQRLTRPWIEDHGFNLVLSTDN